MTKEELQEKWDSGKYVCYTKRHNPTCEFRKATDLLTDDKLVTKLIHKKDEHIADAVIANKAILVEAYKYRWVVCQDFFSTYKPFYDYRLAPTQIDSMEDLNELPIIGEEDDEYNISNCTNNIHNRDANSPNNYISITDDKGTVYEFEKPDFECKFYEVVKDSEVIIIGYTKTVAYRPMVWDLEGNAYYGATQEMQFNLTPIAKEWFKTIPKEGIHMLFEREYKSGIFNEIKKVMRYSKSKQYGVEDSDDNFWFVERFKKATKEEIDSLYYEGENNENK